MFQEHFMEDVVQDTNISLFDEGQMLEKKEDL